jgi:hypothetical protein
MPPTIRFRVPLTCANCGTSNDARSIDLYSSGLGNDPIDTSASPGELLELDADEFDAAYLKLAEPGETFVAIEIWGCASCHRLQAARLTFRRKTPGVVEFVGAAVTSLTKQALDEASYVTRRIDEWAPLPGDDVERIAELVRRLSA